MKHILSITILFFLSNTGFAQSLDELSSFCSHRHAVKSNLIIHRLQPCKRHHVHKKRKHHVKRGKTKVAKATAIVEETEGLYLIERNPRACFFKLLTGVKYEVDLLPPCFKVYVNKDNVVKLRPEPEFEVREVPIFNQFLRAPGCYIACLSYNSDKSVYALAPGIYMVGSIRVRGSYVSGSCIPEGYETRDIRGEKVISELCSKSFSCIGNSCWGYGQTGSWFGLK